MRVDQNDHNIIYILADVLWCLLLLQLLFHQEALCVRKLTFSAQAKKIIGTWLKFLLETNLLVFRLTSHQHLEHVAHRIASHWWDSLPCDLTRVSLQLLNSRSWMNKWEQDIKKRKWTQSKINIWNFYIMQYGWYIWPYKQADFK